MQLNKSASERQSRTNPHRPNFLPQSADLSKVDFGYPTMNPEVGTREDLLDALAKTNGFTQEQLEKNRNNTIARSQIARLVALALLPLWRGSKALLGWALLLIVIYTFMPNSALIEVGINAPEVSLGCLAVTIGVVGVVLAGLIESVFTLTQLCRDIGKGESVCIKGRLCTSRSKRWGVGIDKLHGEKHENYSYAIGKLYFPVTSLAYEALNPYSGTNCKVYIAPRSQLLLSVEPVGMRSAWHEGRIKGSIA